MKFVYKIFFCSIVIIIIVNKLTESKPQFRIAHGFNVPDGEFSSIVRISINYLSGTFLCSGVLLDDETVLTAAHCADPGDYKSIIVYIGEKSHSTKFTREVKKVIKHENHKRTRDDLALYQLDSPIPHSENIKYPNLPSREITNPGDSIYIVGWGEPNYQLAATNQTVVSNEECYKKHAGTIGNWLGNIFGDWYGHIFGEFLNGIRSGRQICSIGRDSETSTACGGDSGGPGYYFDNNGNQWVVGITSYGEKRPCGTSLKPSVMMRVSAYYDWIKENRKKISKTCENFQFSSHVRVQVTANSSEAKCSGVLLDDQIVLTAAQCTAMDGRKSVIVNIGDNNFQTGPAYKFTREVKKIIMHENFKYSHNDIALYLLDSPIPRHEDIKYANIPSEELTKPGDTVCVLVFGQTVYNLAITNQRVITKEKCYETYKSNEIHNGKQICTNEKGSENRTDVCPRNAGAPGYFVDNNGKPWVIGIHSYGAPCGSKLKPSVMMRVSSYYNWIEQNRKQIKIE